MGYNNLNSPFTLPCGVTIKNRLVKAALTERISNKKYQSTQGHIRLYKRWAETGAGLLITGNVIIDRVHLESAGNVCLDRVDDIPRLKEWAASGQVNGCQIWVQISHGGRQANIFSTLRPKAPSSVRLNKMGLFGTPIAMTQKDIEEVIKGFVRAAKISKSAGFDGIQIHSAHGYLLSQFLSPRTNIRTDLWGGNISNRSKLLVEIIRAVRIAVGPMFPIGVKLNSSDFQKGGLTERDALQVVKILEKENIDLLEISGGTYEKVAFFLLNEEVGKTKKSTLKREAYFIDFAKKIRSISNIPLMITGGFRSREFCKEVLENDELDFIGMGRPFISNIDEIDGFLSGKIESFKNLVLRTGIKQLEDTAEGGFYAKQLIRLSEGNEVNLKMHPLLASLFFITYEMRISIWKKIF